MRLQSVAFLLALGVASSALAELTPVQPMLPVDVPYSYAEWESIMDSQALLPEECDGCKEGTYPQPDIAGRTALSGHPGVRIIGGFVAEPRQFPWQVQVRMDDSYFCGGSLISDEWVLSAGHCASGFSRFTIVMGTLYSNKGASDPDSVTINTREAHVHEKYNSWLISDDVSVIRLPKRIESWSDFIRPVRLPSPSQDGTTFAGEKAVLSGWGRYGTSTVSPSISPVLRYVQLDVISNAECAQRFGSAIRSTNICTSGGTSSPIGACNGDSGGPLGVTDNGTVIQVGIVSFGTSLGCNKKYPTAYTRTTAYLKWISDKTDIAF